MTEKVFAVCALCWMLCAFAELILILNMGRRLDFLERTVKRIESMAYKNQGNIFDLECRVGALEGQAEAKKEITYLDDYMAKFPDVELNEEGAVDGVCPDVVYKGAKSLCLLEEERDGLCRECWEQPLKGGGK